MRHLISHVGKTTVARRAVDTSLLDDNADSFALRLDAIHVYWTNYFLGEI